jgi:hypothetical protein
VGASQVAGAESSATQSGRLIVGRKGRCQYPTARATPYDHRWPAFEVALIDHLMPGKARPRWKLASHSLRCERHLDLIAGGRRIEHCIEEDLQTASQLEIASIATSPQSR